MKKIILGLVALTGVVVANAQTAQNDWMVGGNLRLNTSDNNTTIGFTPSAGLFVIDNLAVGGNFGLNYNKSGDNKTTTFTVGPFVRYYFTTATETIRPIVQGNFNYLSSKVKTPLTSSTNNGINYFIGGGAAMFISQNVSIDALLGYDHTKFSDFDGKGGFAFNVGFQVYINKGQVDKIRGKK